VGCKILGSYRFCIYFGLLNLLFFFYDFESFFFFIFFFLILFCFLWSIDRSSLNPDNDKTTYGAFVDVDPAREKLSLRSLVSSYEITLNIFKLLYFSTRKSPSFSDFKEISKMV